MIYSIRGTISVLEEDSLVLEVQGIGYQVFIPSFYSSKLTINSEILLWTYHHIREDQQILFGFLKQDEKNLFLKLIQISGIGPKVALKILSSFPPQDFVRFILESNVHALVQVPGIGKKVAERMVMELKDKLDGVALQTEGLSSTLVSNEFQKDLMAALKTLGYTQDEVKRAFQQCASSLQDKMSLEEGMKVLLKQL